MAHVCTFWRLPDEEVRFLDYLDKTGDILACTIERMPDPTSALLEPRPLRQFVEERNETRMLFGPREFMDMAQLMEFEEDGRVVYGRYYMCGPLVTYSRGVFWGPKQLGSSNLVFETFSSTLNDADSYEKRWTPQPPEFIAWGKRVLNWARRHTPRVVDHKRMTERVFAELANGLELVH